MSLYETEKYLREYLLFHYGKPEEILPWKEGPSNALNFPVRSVTECLRPERVPPAARALDLGCAVGRASFELAKTHSEVIGIDFSHAFVETANRLAQEGSMPYERLDEGALTTRCVAEVEPGIDRTRVHFEVGDATCLRQDLGQFDTLLLANLVCRLPDPDACLGRLPGLAKPGAQLIITSPYSWMEDYTPREKWLGGYMGANGAVHSLDGLRGGLESHFELLDVRDLAMLIREHVRKYQWTVCQASIWIRK